MVLVLPTGVLAGLAMPADAPAQDPPVARSGEGHPPWKPVQVPREVEARFLDAWRGRLATPGWLQAYLDGPENAVRDEFVTRPLAERQGLIEALVQDLLQDPVFGPRVHPPNKPSEWRERETFAKMLWYSWVFDKSVLRDAFQRATQEEPVAPDRLEGATQVQPEHRDPFTGEPIVGDAGLAARFAAARTIAPIPEPALPPEPLPPALPDVVREEAMPAQGLAPPPVGLGVALGTEPAPWPEAMPAWAAAPEQPAQPRVTPPLVKQIVDSVVNSGTNPEAALLYVPCGQIGDSATVTCSRVALPLGTPGALDLDGNPTNGVGGMDVTVTLGPGVGTSGAPGASVELHVQPQPPGRVLPAKVWTVWALPHVEREHTKVLRAGLNGTASRLPHESVVSLTVRDLTALLLDGHALVDLDIRFLGPLPPNATLFAEFNEVTDTGEPIHPARVEVTLEPPADLLLDLDAWLDASSMSGNLTTRGGARPLARVLYFNDRTSGGVAYDSTATVAIDRLPTQMLVRAEFPKDEEEIRLRYGASGTVDAVNVTYVRHKEGQSLWGRANVTSLPGNITLLLNPNATKGSVRYAADREIPRVEGSFSRIKDGVTTTGTVDVLRIPGHLNVTWDTNATIAVNETLSIGGGTNITYETSGGRLGPVNASLSSGTGRLAIEASLTGLPPFLQALFVEDYVALDARTSQDATPGSASIGTVRLKFADDGVFLSGPRPDMDYVYAEQPDPEVTRLDLDYSGLRNVTANLRNNETHVLVGNVAPRQVAYSVGMAKGVVSGYIHSVPSMVAIDIAGGNYTYDSFGGRIETLFVRYEHKGFLGPKGSMRIEGIPGRLDLTLDLDPKNTSNITYRATGRVDRIVFGKEYEFSFGEFAAVPIEVPVEAFGTWRLRGTLTSIPLRWDLSFGDEGFLLDVPGGDRIGAVNLEVSNVPRASCMSLLYPERACAGRGGALLTLLKTLGYIECTGLTDPWSAWRASILDPLTVTHPYDAPRMCVELDLPARRIDAVLSLRDVRRVQYRNETDGTYLEFRAGDGGPFAGRIQRTPTSNFSATLQFNLSALPTEISLLTGKRIEYKSNAKVDLDILATFGNPAGFAYIPGVPWYPLGITLRDGAARPGAASAGEAMRARVVLTGLPTSLTIRLPDGDEDKFFLNAQGWAPKSTTLDVDVDLDHVLPVPFRARTRLQDVVPAAGATQDIHTYFQNPTYELAGEKTRVVELYYKLKQPIGPVTAHVIWGENQSRAFLSQVPAEAYFLAAIGEREKNISFIASNGIDKIVLGVAAKPEPLTEFDGTITVTDVPARWQLDIGRTDVGPTVHYTASASTLDAILDVRASLFGDPVVKVRAEVHAMLTNLGADTTVTVNEDDPSLAVASVPGTEYFLVEAWGHLRATPSDAGTETILDIEVARLTLDWEYAVDLEVTVQRLRVEVEQVRTLNVKLVPPLFKVEGDYQRFHFGWDDLDLRFAMTGGVQFGLCLWLVIGDACFPLMPLIPFVIDLPPVRDIWFHKANNHLVTIFSIPRTHHCMLLGKAWYSLDVSIRPHLHGAELNEFTVHGPGFPGDEGGNDKWYILPDLPSGDGPLLDSTPTWLIIALAADGGDTDFDVNPDIGWDWDLCV